MSKGKGRKGRDERRTGRGMAEFAALQERAAAEPGPAMRREHITPVEIDEKEEKYERLLFAIESGLVEFYDERNGLPVDEEAERALRLLIARFEGDSGRRSGSPDVDAMAERVSRNIDLHFRRHPLLTRAEIIGCLRRIIASIATWHIPENPRAYFDFVGDYVRNAERAAAPDNAPTRSRSGLWIPGQGRPSDEEEDEEETPRRPGGIWLPGDR